MIIKKNIFRPSTLAQISTCVLTTWASCLAWRTQDICPTWRNQLRGKKCEVSLTRKIVVILRLIELILSGFIWCCTITLTYHIFFNLKIAAPLECLKEHFKGGRETRLTINPKFVLKEIVKIKFLWLVYPGRLKVTYTLNYRYL